MSSKVEINAALVKQLNALLPGKQGAASDLAAAESVFGGAQHDLNAAQETISKYFDTRAKQTQTAQALLKQVQGSNLSINMPTLDSLAAIRTYKNKR